MAREGKILILVDLDKEQDHAQVYADLVATKKYLENVISSIEKRVLDGEQIDGLRVVPGNKTRYITATGVSYLRTIFTEDELYEKKLIGITKLDEMVGEKDMAYLIANKLVDYKYAKDKVIVE